MGEWEGKRVGEVQRISSIENRQEEVKNSIGNVEAKELISMTHGHELKGGSTGGRGVYRVEGNKGGGNGTTIIA